MEERPEFLYLTTIGSVTGKPREIEIWFVESEGIYYVLSEHRREAHWVKNISKNSRVHVRLSSGVFDATARVLSEESDQQAYEMAQRLMREKYDWGDGLPVQLSPQLMR